MATSTLSLQSRRITSQHTRLLPGGFKDKKSELEKTFPSEIPGQAHVAVLEPDATNIINVVEGGYEGITTSIQVELDNIANDATSRWEAWGQMKGLDFSS